MTTSDHQKMFTQLVVKPAKLKKFIKHNQPKKRRCGQNTKKCKLCGRTHAHVQKYGLEICRQCFRLNAKKMGFKKYM
jgi:ribosomal protein S14